MFDIEEELREVDSWLESVSMEHMNRSRTLDRTRACLRRCGTQMGSILVDPRMPVNLY